MEVRWTVTPSEGKDSDSGDSHLLFLCFDLFCSFFGDFFSFFIIFFPPPTIVVLDFIGILKSN